MKIQAGGEYPVSKMGIASILPLSDHVDIFIEVVQIGIFLYFNRLSTSYYKHDI